MPAETTNIVVRFLRSGRFTTEGGRTQRLRKPVESSFSRYEAPLMSFVQKPTSEVRKREIEDWLVDVTSVPFLPLW